MRQPRYDSDLSDKEWQEIESLLPATQPVGKHREVDLRDVLHAIFYRADNGIQWRGLPCNFPAWQTVYGYYRLWVRLGIWEQIGCTKKSAASQKLTDLEPQSWAGNSDMPMAFLL